ncbi:MAG: hypothetical protein AAGA96_20260 [Verrucomicrobiota bacterium]
MRNVVPLAVFLIALPMGAQDQPVSKETAELFQVSRVGQRNVAETRELLGVLYGKVASKYDAALKEEQSKKKPSQLYKGESIRILRPLQENNPKGDLYLCAYQGTPSVFRIEGKQFQRGQLSPPLLPIKSAGEHTTEITRRVKNPDSNSGAGPSLQKVDESSGGGVTFFGIALDGGGSQTGSSPPSDEYKEIKETRTLPLFHAQISTEKLEQGPPPMSQQLFLSMVKNGEVFTVKNLELRRCQECRGFGKVTDTRPPGQRGADGKMPCPECNGPGKIQWDVTYKVGW